MDGSVAHIRSSFSFVQNVMYHSHPEAEWPAGDLALVFVLLVKHQKFYFQFLVDRKLLQFSF